MARLRSPLREFPVFGSRKSRGTAEFVIQSRSRGRTLISDCWDVLRESDQARKKGKWHFGAVRKTLSHSFFNLTIVYISNETKEGGSTFVWLLGLCVG